MSNNDEWGTTSGLRGDDEVLSIAEAEFTFDARYNNGNTVCLRLVIADENGNPSEDDILLPCGDKFDVDKHGFLVGEDGGRRKPNANSAFGMWINAALKAAGEKLTSRGAQGDPRVWVGTTWHTIREERTFKIRNGEERTTSRIVPIEWIDNAGNANGGAGNKASNVGDGAGTTKVVASESANGAVPGAVRAKLVALAKEHDDYDSWMVAAYDTVPEVGSNPQVEALVMDRVALFDKVKG